MKINASIWIHYNKKKTISLIEDKKERQGTEGVEGTNLLEPQKAHPTGEYVIGV